MDLRKLLLFTGVAILLILVGQSSLLSSGGKFIVKSGDNICGLRDARQLSNPAKVDYPLLIDSTREGKRIRDEKIDPKSALGNILMSQAKRRVVDASETVRRRRGYCSIWKAIERRDGKAIPDVTKHVLVVLRAGADEEIKSES